MGYFRYPHRKVGVVVLAVACACMAMWLNLRTIEIEKGSLSTGIGKFTICATLASAFLLLCPVPEMKPKEPVNDEVQDRPEN